MTTVSVLVLEYGPIDRSNITLVPFYATQLNIPAMFDTVTAPEPFLGDSVSPVFVGAVAGGGTTVNGMTYNLASAADYDSWEELGNEGWGFEALRPYHLKVGRTNIAHRMTLLTIARPPSISRHPKRLLSNTATRSTRQLMAKVHLRSRCQIISLRMCNS
jgi:choline dehydrogenase-like flavoprotein